MSLTEDQFLALYCATTDAKRLHDVEIVLQIDMTVLDPNSTYTLRAFFSCSKAAAQTELSCTVVASANNKRVVLQVPQLAERQYDALVLYVFAHYASADGEPMLERRLGYCSIPVQALLNLQQTGLWSETRVAITAQTPLNRVPAQGNVSVMRCVHLEDSQMNTDYEKNVKEAMLQEQKLIQQSETATAALSQHTKAVLREREAHTIGATRVTDQSATFTAIQMHGRMLSYVHATAMYCLPLRNNMPFVAKPSLPTFRWFLHLAYLNLGMPDDTTLPSPFTANAEGKLLLRRVLVEMLTVMFRGLVYSQDIEKRSNKVGDVIRCDEWCPITSMPTQSHAAYDCEDGAFTIFHVFHCFLQQSTLTELADPNLFHLHEYAQTVTLALAFGKIKQSPDDAEHKIWHAYAVLMPRWCAFNDFKVDWACPVESTTFIDNDYSTLALEDRERESKYLALLDSLCDSDPRWQQFGRLRIPTRRLATKNVYGDVHFLFMMNREAKSPLDLDTEASWSQCALYAQPAEAKLPGHKSALRGVPLSNLIRNGFNLVDRQTVATISMRQLYKYYVLASELAPLSLPSISFSSNSNCDSTTAINATRVSTPVLSFRLLFRLMGDARTRELKMRELRRLAQQVRTALSEHVQVPAVALREQTFALFDNCIMTYMDVVI